MIKSTNAYFDTDKLYLVKPSIIVSEKSNSIILKQDIENIDIAFINNTGVYGLVKKKNYDLFDINKIEKNNLYLNIFDDDLKILVEYLFKISMGVNPTDEMIKGLYRNKPYYEIDELKDLHKKILKIETEIDDTKKVKKISRF